MSLERSLDLPRDEPRAGDAERDLPEDVCPLEEEEREVDRDRKCESREECDDDLEELPLEDLLFPFPFSFPLPCPFPVV